MNQFKLICLSLITMISSGCQVISSIFVDYNGVRMDVAKWINHHPFLSMQQKRSLVELSKAQQKLSQIKNKQEEQRTQIIEENIIAMHCARPYLSAEKIKQLQNQIFDHDQKQHILDLYDQERQKTKIDLNTVQCESSIKNLVDKNANHGK